MMNRNKTGDRLTTCLTPPVCGIDTDTETIGVNVQSLNNVKEGRGEEGHRTVLVIPQEHFMVGSIVSFD